MWDLWWTRWHWDKYFLPPSLPQVLQYCTDSITTPVLNTHSLIYHQHYINLAINIIIKEHKRFISNLYFSTLLINIDAN